MKIRFKQFMIDKSRMAIPVPMRIMKGIIKQETSKAYYVVLQGVMEPSSNCHHCGKRITNPVSLLYGLGMHCGQHFGIPKMKDEKAVTENYSKLKELIESVKFEGWVAKKGVEQIIYDVEFYHNGVKYVDHTGDILRISEIKNKAEKYYIR